MTERERLARLAFAVLYPEREGWSWEVGDHQDRTARGRCYAVADALLADRLERTVTAVEAMEDRIEAAERRAEEAEAQVRALRAELTLVTRKM